MDFRSIYLKCVMPFSPEEHEIFSQLRSDLQRVRFVLPKMSRELVNFGAKLKTAEFEKSASRSKEWRETGNTAFRNNDFKAVIDSFNRSILLAPWPTSANVAQTKTTSKQEKGSEGETSLALGFANRSAALYRLSEFDHCLEDIESALRFGYPLEMRHKLLSRKAQCLEAMGRPGAEIRVAYEDVIASLSENDGDRTAKLDELKVKNDSSANVSSDGDKKAELTAKLDELKVKYDPSTTVSNVPANVSSEKKFPWNPIPPLADGSNPQMPSASSAVSLANSATKGRHIVANRDIEPGEVLLVEPAFAFSLLPDFFSTHCTQCFKRSCFVFPCRQCNMIQYCSADCESVAWKSFHRFECGPVLDCVRRNSSDSNALTEMFRIISVAGYDCLHRFWTTHVEMIVGVTETELTKPNASSEIAEVGESKAASDVFDSSSYDGAYQMDTHTEHVPLFELEFQTVTAVLLLYLLKRGGFFEKSAEGTGDKFSAENKDQVTNNQQTRNTKAAEFTPFEQFIGSLYLRHLQSYPLYAFTVQETELLLRRGGDGAYAGEKSAAEGDSGVTSVGSMAANSTCSSDKPVGGGDKSSGSDDGDRPIAIGEVRRIGGGLFTAAGLFNHSCHPNADQNHHGTVMIVRAIRSIAAGAEVCISYGPTYATEPLATRCRKFDAFYHFECDCAACAERWPMFAELPSFDGGDRPYLRCPQCGATIAAASLSYVSRIINVFRAPEPDNQCANCSFAYTGDEVAEIIAALQKSSAECFALVALVKRGQQSDAILRGLERHLKMLEKHVVPPWRDYFDCIEAMKHCYSYRAICYFRHA